MKEFEILKNEFENNTVFQSGFSWEIDVPLEFQEWFVSNGEYLNQTIKTIPDNLIVSQSTDGQCFHNSQLLAIENQNIEYYEGIMYGPKFGYRIHHGFNTIENNTIDITYIKNLENFLNEGLRDKYYIYFGIKIPKEFVLIYYEKLKTPNVQNPIILDYYNHIIEKQ